MATIYTVIHNELTDDYTAYLTDYEELKELTFNPYNNAVCIIDFVLHGKTYQEKKAALEEMAKEYQHNQAGGLFMNQEIAITNYFEENARRYGLLEVFRENCII